jgi:hypothetical protein
MQGTTLIRPSLSIWSLPDELTNFIITTFFKQTRQEMTALIIGELPSGQQYAWLYTPPRYYPISLADHEKFQSAAKSRGGDYTLEICEFTVEKMHDNGSVALKWWRHVADESGEGGRATLVQQHGRWAIAQ